MKYLLFLSLIGFTSADFKPRKYRIDLDLPPDQRWNQVIRENIEVIPLIAEEAKKYIPSFIQPVVWPIARALGNLLPKDIHEELKGISRESGLPLGEVVGLNILYDITAFDRKHILYEGCTSIVLQDKRGNIFHGRNLDYEMQDLLKSMTIYVDFVKNNTILYSGVTFALYNGLLTGQRPNAYTVTLNERYSGAYIDNILMEFVTRFQRPVSYFIREVLESETTFDSAVRTFSKTHLIAPCYIIVGGVKPEQGVVISRNRWSAADIYSLTPERWYLVETNFDHWKKDDDGRRFKFIN
ncbi:hypothetical protein WR25_10766 isoform B [Diploscapter pachys]|uniref:Ceramidase n=1 Tax=Diploscapter pachys TaxID=2018661 RepID=A0A2A2JBQ6_9BILA|nr:hypothetical protein WR25_10766 isoform B [Diploscapter pachys]